MAVVVLLALASIISVVIYLSNLLKRPPNYPPGPNWLPLIENHYLIKQQSRLYGGLHQAFQKLSELYKTNVLGLKLGGVHVIAVSTYPLVKTVLSSDAFEGKPDNFFLRLRCMGRLKGIVCTDGPLWAEQRNYLVRCLKNAGFGKKTMESLIVEELADILKQFQEKGPDVEFEPILEPSVLNIVWSLLTGMRLHHEDPRLQNLLSMFRKRGSVFDMAGGTLNQYPWLRHIIPDRIGYKLLLNINKELKEFFMEIIRYHHETWEPNRQDNLIYRFISERYRLDESKESFTDDQLVIIFLDLFLGASQTSGSALSFILLRLLVHPEIQEKVYKEISESLDPNEPLSYADRVKVPYVDAVISEVSRMYPIAALAAPRRAVKDTVLDGYHIPAGSTIFANIYSVHHDREFWGDPEAFRPERFLNKNGTVQYGERLLNFGLGRRRCPGEQLARQAIFIFLVGILRKYKICSVPNSELPSMEPAIRLFLTPQKYKARLIPLKDLRIDILVQSTAATGAGNTCSSVIASVVHRQLLKFEIVDTRDITVLQLVELQTRLSKRVNHVVYNFRRQLSR
ncbi:Cytochrome P450 305a1 [Carabus blaptoides fortunei]